jgi:hypothetical protein
MSAPHEPRPPTDHPYLAHIPLERARWQEFTALCRSLTPEERTLPGYYSDPAWSVKDLVAHIGTWLAEAQIQLERVTAGTYEELPIDVDALNAKFLDAMRGQPWPVVWVQAHAARNWMLRAWFGVRTTTDAANWWASKSGADHYEEHLPRLRDWVAELAAARRQHR